MQRRHGQVRLARTCIAKQTNGLLAGQITAFAQAPQQRRRNVRRVLEVEVFQGLDRRKVGFLDASRHGPAIAFFDLCFQQHLQVAQVRLLLAHGFIGQAGGLIAQCGQVELLGILLDRVQLHRLLSAH